MAGAGAACGLPVARGRVSVCSAPSHARPSARVCPGLCLRGQPPPDAVRATPRHFVAIASSQPHARSRLRTATCTWGRGVGGRTPSVHSSKSPPGIHFRVQRSLRKWVTEGGVLSLKMS